MSLVPGQRSLSWVKILLILFCLGSMVMLALWRAWPSLFYPPLVEVKLDRRPTKSVNPNLLRLEISVTQHALWHVRRKDSYGQMDTWGSSRGHFGPPWKDTETRTMPAGDWVRRIKPDTIYQLPLHESLVLATDKAGKPTLIITCEPERESWGTLWSEIRRFWNALRPQPGYRAHLHEMYPRLPVIEVRE